MLCCRTFPEFQLCSRLAPEFGEFFSLISLEFIHSVSVWHLYVISMPPCVSPESQWQRYWIYFPVASWWLSSGISGDGFNPKNKFHSIVTSALPIFWWTVKSCLRLWILPAHSWHWATDSCRWGAVRSDLRLCRAACPRRYGTFVSDTWSLLSEARPPRPLAKHTWTSRPAGRHASCCLVNTDMFTSELFQKSFTLTV